VTDVDNEKIWSGLRRHFDALDTVAPTALREPGRRMMSNAVPVRAGRASVDYGAATVGVVLVAVVALAVRAGALGDRAGATSLTSTSPVAALLLPAAIASSEPRVAQSCTEAALQGVLAGDPADPRLLWLQAQGSRIDINWPRGFTVRFGQPTELIAPDGTNVAKVGDQLQLGGGYGPNGDIFGACSVNGRTYPG